MAETTFKTADVLLTALGDNLFVRMIVHNVFLHMHYVLDGQPCYSYNVIKIIIITYICNVVVMYNFISISHNSYLRMLIPEFLSWLCLQKQPGKYFAR